MGWPSPPSGEINIPSHGPRRLESLISILTTKLKPFITPNTQVAIYHLQPSATLVSFFAITRLQAIPIFLNDRYTTPDLIRALTILPPAAVLTTHSPLQPLLRIVPLVLVLADDPPFSYTVTPSLSPLRLPPVVNLPNHTAAVFFTSGTTSVPKPVPLTFQNLTVQSVAKVTYLQLSTSTVYLHLAPLYHLAGFSSTLAVVLSNATHILPQNHHPSIKTHAKRLLSLIHHYAVTLLVAVPTTLRLLLDAANHPLPSVKTVLYGGSASSETLLNDLHTIFPNATIFGAYGMTETASSLTISRGIGPSRPLPYVKLAILQDDHKILQQGHGEILTKGPQVFPGYYNRGEEGFVQGWFKTGDIGKLTKQGLVLLGRRLEMIKSGGENVYAGEVESVLMTHSSVRDAAVVGLPHRVLGEAVAACVVLVGDDGNDVITSLQGFCRTILAHFKCPRWIFATAELPRNATGKVVKTRVREILEHSLRRRAKL